MYEINMPTLAQGTICAKNTALIAGCYRQWCMGLTTLTILFGSEKQVNKLPELRKLSLKWET